MPVSTHRVVRLSEVCTRITVGHVGPMRDRYVQDGIPFLRSQNIAPFHLDLTDLKFIPADFHRELRKSVLQPGDVVVVRTGYPGTACVIPKSLPESNCADLVVITASGLINPYYLAAVFNSSWGQAVVAGRLVGVAQQHFNITVAREMQIGLPPRSEQDRIVGIFSAYEELIERNLRRIGILESMARVIYSEWFVDMRYPGDGRVNGDRNSRVRSSDWDARRLGDLARIDRGLSYKGVHLVEEGVPMVNLKCISPGGGFQRDGVKGYSGGFKASHAVHAGDIVFANTDLTQAGRIIGSAAILPYRVFSRGGLASHHICVVRPGGDPSLRSYLYQTLLDSRFRDFARSRASGTTVLGFRSEDAAEYPIPVPPAYVLKAFQDVVDPLHALAELLVDQVENLRTTRDLLLPRLMAGRLSLAEAEAAV